MYSKFIIDSINSDLYITSDSQFGAQGLFENIPDRKLYGDINKFHAALVENWNSVIGEDDFVLCLGDFTQNLKDKTKSMQLVEQYSRKLNGKKYLIRGNHDAEDTSWYYDCGWNCLLEYPLIILDNKMDWVQAPTVFCGCVITEVNGLRILFSHFAINEKEEDDQRYLVEKAFLRDLYQEYECNVNIHGHNHTRSVNHDDCVSVCVEHTLFTPVRLGQFLAQYTVGNQKKSA